MAAPDPAAVARVKAALDADPDLAVIATALKQTTLDLRALAAQVLRTSPWVANGPGRWRHTRGLAQIAAGTPGVRMAEMSDNGDGTATVFLYDPAPAPDPTNDVGGPMDGLLASATRVVATPNTVAAAYAILEAAVGAGHL